MTPEQRPPIVAELGRPETPEETASRKAESSRDRRSHQTVNNLVLSLLATLAIVVVIVLIVPHGTPAAQKPVDYRSIAASAQGTEPDPLISPRVPKTWYSNSAVLSTDTTDRTDNWYIGLITGDNQYIAIRQGFKADRTWLADQLKGSVPTSAVTIDGVNWKVYDNRHSSRDVGDVHYAMSTTVGHSTYLLFGTADDADFRTLARAVAHELTTASATS